MTCETSHHGASSWRGGHGLMSSLGKTHERIL